MRTTVVTAVLLVGCSASVDELTRVDEVPAGDGVCANGGVRAAEGPDTDGDGVLDESEVTNEVQVCAPDGSGGPPWVVERDSSVVLPACTYGGVVLVVGRDSDGDGQATDEADAQRFVLCDGPDGERKPVEVHGLVDLDSVTLPLVAGVERVVGDLVVSEVDSFAPLASLVEVTDDVLLQVFTATTLDGFESLTTVGGTLAIQEGYQLVSVDALAGLTTVRDGIYLDFLPRLCDSAWEDLDARFDVEADRYTVGGDCAP